MEDNNSMVLQQRPLLSIIVPVYNVGHCIRECMDSVLGQTFQDFELILIDDGSEDCSGEICDSYAQKYPRVQVHHQRNSGVSTARNLGIEKAKGEWICFVDSDDWIEKDHLEKFFQYPLDKYMVVFQGILFDYDKEPEDNIPFFQYGDCLFGMESLNDMVENRILHNGCPCAKLFNRELLNEHSIRFIPQISTHEDHIFVWTYLQYIRQIRLSASLSYHYMQRNVVSLSTKFHSSDEYIEVSRMFQESLSVLKNRCGLEDTLYIKEVYTDYGLQQLLRALNNMDKSNACAVLSFVKSRESLFHDYFSGHVSRGVRLFLWLLFHGLHYKILYLLVRMHVEKQKIYREKCIINGMKKTINNY